MPYPGLLHTMRAPDIMVQLALLYFLKEKIED